MNALCFVFVLFAIRIIYAKEEPSVDRIKTASSSATGGKTPKNLYRGIDFDKVELFKDDDKPHNDPQEVKKDVATSQRGNQTSEKIYEDYDVNDLHLQQYKFMAAPKTFKTIDASKVRFLNRNSNSHDTSNRNSVAIAMAMANSSPGKMPIPQNQNNSVTPSSIPWVISPSCAHDQESKYLFSAIFNKKPTVHLLAANNGTTDSKQTPNIIIDNDSVTMSKGNATVPANDNMKRKEVLKTSPNPVAVGTSSKAVAVTKPGQTNIKKEVIPTKASTVQTAILQNKVIPQSYAVAFANAGGVDSINPSNLTAPFGSNLIPNATPQIPQKTLQFMQNLQNNVALQAHPITPGTQQINPMPPLVNQNNPLKIPILGRRGLTKTLNHSDNKPPDSTNNILGAELTQRSFFTSEANENFKRPTEKKKMADLIQHNEMPDTFNEFLKNMTITNGINENLNRKLLNESQLHTQQNWQMIKDNFEILNALKKNNG